MTTFSEGLSLLRKWDDDSSPLVVIFVSPGAETTFLVFGRVLSLTDSELVIADKYAHVTVCLDGALFRYSDKREVPPSLSQHAHKIVSAIDLTLRSGQTIRLLEQGPLL